MTDENPAQPTQSFTWEVLRALDLLRLRFTFANLAPEGGRVGAPLTRLDPAQPAYVVVDLGPQHIAEEAERDPWTTGQAIPLRHRLARPSRLAFQLRTGVNSLPFTLDALIGWDAMDPVLVPVMIPPGPGQPLPQIRQPTSWETAIELPYRLVLSPSAAATWEHTIRANDHEGRAELWHTRLVPDPSRRPPEHTSTVRAVYSPDYWPAPSPLPAGADFPLKTLGPKDRRELVHLTSNYALRDRSGHAVPTTAIPVERLMLSGLGGWLRVHAWFPEHVEDIDQTECDLIEWQHIATEARDHYVKEVHAGTLFPFGIRANKVIISERKITQFGDGPVAALLQKQFIVVRERFKDYTTVPYANGGREMPIKTIQVLTRVTPDLMPDPGPVIAGLTDSIKVLLPSGDPALFHLQGTDVTGALIAFDVGMLWLSDTDAAGQASAVQSALQGVYDADDTFRRSAVNGQRLYYARPPSRVGRLITAGDTSLHTNALRFRGQFVGDTTNFLPVMRDATVHIPAVQALAGPGAPELTIAMAPAYLDYGLDDAVNNAAGLFAQIVDAGGKPVSAATKIPAKYSGGLVNPNLAASGLSAHLGPVAGNLDQLATGTFNPQDFFGGAGMLLLGAIPVGQLVRAAATEELFDLGQMPQTVTRLEPPGGVPTKAVTTLSWAPQVDDNPKLAELGFQKGPDCALTISSVITTQLAGGAPNAVTDATLTNFTFLLPPGNAAVIKIHFSSLAFHNQTGTKGDVSVSLAGGTDAVEFAGVLAFLDELRKYIPSDGFSDPPAVEITDAGVTTGYSLGLPPLAIGVFDLTDIRLGASLDLPFTAGKPRLRVNFSERDHPCHLTVSALGGGAFLALAVGLDGIEAIEAAIEFGGAFSLDIGVASGSVSVMAGIYFRYDDTQHLTELQGYLRIDGSVEVLGLVTVSVEFLMSFSYIPKGAAGVTIEGQATLTVKVDLTLFSTSVSMTVRRSFGSKSGDPTFAQLMPAASDWADYAASFAA
jgi:hypothetical protein